MKSPNDAFLKTYPHRKRHMIVRDCVPDVHLLFDTSALKAVNHKTSAECDRDLA